MGGYLSTPETQETRFAADLRLRLEKTGVDVTQFYELLKNTNSIIAGSLPIQVLLNIQWANSDIDVFTTDPEVVSYFKDRYDADDLTHEGTYYSMGYIKSVTQFDLSPPSHTYTSLQVILLEPCNVTLNLKDGFYTRTQFDIDVCSILFDGIDVNIPDNIDLDNFMTVNLDLIATKGRKSQLKAYARYCKYRNDRGFYCNDNMKVRGFFWYLHPTVQFIAGVFSQNDNVILALADTGEKTGYTPPKNIADRKDSDGQFPQDEFHLPECCIHCGITESAAENHSDEFLFEDGFCPECGTAWYPVEQPIYAEYNKHMRIMGGTCHTHSKLLELTCDILDKGNLDAVSSDPGLNAYYRHHFSSNCYNPF